MQCFVQLLGFSKQLSLSLWHISGFISRCGAVQGCAALPSALNEVVPVAGSYSKGKRLHHIPRLLQAPRTHTLPGTNSCLFAAPHPQPHSLHAVVSPIKLEVCLSHPTSAISIFCACRGRCLVQPVLDANIQLLSHLISDFHLVCSNTSPPHPLPCSSVLGWHLLSPLPISILLLQLFLWVGLCKSIPSPPTYS